MQVTDAMVEAALVEYRASDLDGKALIRAMLESALRGDPKFLAPTHPVSPGVWRHEDDSECVSYPDVLNFTYVEDGVLMCRHGVVRCHRRTV